MIWPEMYWLKQELVNALPKCPSSSKELSHDSQLSKEKPGAVKTEEEDKMKIGKKFLMMKRWQLINETWTTLSAYKLSDDLMAKVPIPDLDESMSQREHGGGEWASDMSA